MRPGPYDNQHSYNYYPPFGSIDPYNQSYPNPTVPLASVYPPPSPSALQPPPSVYPGPPAQHSYSGPLSNHTYPQHSYPQPTSYSGPLDYSHPPLAPVFPQGSAFASPTHYHHSSINYGQPTSSFPPQASSVYPPPSSSQVPSRVNSWNHHNGHDCSSSEGSCSSRPSEGFNATTVSSSSTYPPLEDTSCLPSAPPVPSVTAVRPSPMSYQSLSFGSGRQDYARIDSMGANTTMNFAHSYSFNDAQHVQNMQLVPTQTGKTSLKVLLLHGKLDILVMEAKNLPNMDMFHNTLSNLASGIPLNKITGGMSVTSDPYVLVSISRAVVARTFVFSNSENPVWNQKFTVPVAHYAAELQFTVKDSDIIGAQMIGVVSIPVEQIYTGIEIKGTYPILNSNGKPCKPGAVLKLSIQYTPEERYGIYSRGMEAGPNTGIPGTFYPLRKGGKVKLYQDAHVLGGTLPNLLLENQISYVHGTCWQDIFDAIRGATCLIYIAGWSVWHKVTLIRDSRYPSQTLGDLLKAKTQEAVRVLLLIWDDPTSGSFLGYKSDGIMATHDEETRKFFNHSSVRVLLCPRTASNRHSFVRQREVETIYTHHQKTVIVDADAGNGKRKIVAFVGGLDLCDGRYDTPRHSLFGTLQTVHKDDCHNPTYTENLPGGPREPWHDLHSKIEGPAAYDILQNFESRWRKISKPRGLKKLKSFTDDSLVAIDRISNIMKISDFSENESDPESWHVQIFRSIDSSSVSGFPKNPVEAYQQNLACGKNVIIDMSIHTAYVTAIRAAQHFIYVENQYFIGSSYNWVGHNDLGADNLIPMEIALKISKKIKAKERFAAYIVIPMWPEGNPTSASTQRILYWQGKTMQMMYTMIYKALVEAGLEKTFSPQDYLNFFCLGNREVVSFDSAGSPTSSSLNTPQALCQRYRRFMIYVHSKGMIVDDEYVIIGSANINQRSMDGSRDSEIAMGAYQPHHTWSRKHSPPYGQVYGYRMSLWAEHLGGIDDLFTMPGSIECVRRVRTMGEMNWKQYVAPEVTEMRGHLVKYPVDVDWQGKVRALSGCETFPDVGGNILGTFIPIKENLTT